jgi:beta-glucanase (GH16 family)
MPGSAIMVLLLAACGGSGGGGGSTPTPTPTSSPDTPDTALEWSDEFDGAAGALADSSKWLYEVQSTPPNNELEYYTARPENGSLSGNGMLVITSRAEHYTGADGITREYTSARLNTSGKFETRHGTISARIKVPSGHGMWPAFWMMGNNLGTVGWPTCGEIDIMENIGNTPSTVYGSMHGPGYSGGNDRTASVNVPGVLSDDFHVFSIVWEKESIRWLVDGTEYEHRTPSDVNGLQWVFEHPFFILLNNAVGGSWPGPPDSTTVFPQQMLVDYVRVSRKAT